jgi:hypothetical protein
MQNEIICPKQKEIAVFIHGVWTEKRQPMNSLIEQLYH